MFFGRTWTSETFSTLDWRCGTGGGTPRGGIGGLSYKPVGEWGGGSGFRPCSKYCQLKYVLKEITYSTTRTWLSRSLSSRCFWRKFICGVDWVPLLLESLRWFGSGDDVRELTDDPSCSLPYWLVLEGFGDDCDNWSELLCCEIF